MTVKYVVSGYSSYRVYHEGEAIGTVDRTLTGRRTWRWYAEGGGSGEARTRTKATDALLELFARREEA